MFRTLASALAVVALAGAAPAHAFPAREGAPPPPRPDNSLRYGGLLRAVTAHEIRRATFRPNEDAVDVRLTDGSQHHVALIDGVERPLAARLAATGVDVRVDDAGREDGQGSTPPIIVGVLGAMTLMAVAGLIVADRARRRRLMGADTGPGGSRRAAEQAAQHSLVRFADVAGCDEAVEEVSELVAFLRERERFDRVGARMPSGVILHGPPGTGKTLLAKALAGEAGVPFFAVSGSDFVEKYVGVGARRVRELFAKARRCEHGAVIFIDEIDAVGARRSGGEEGSHEGDHTLNQLLAELDGFHHRDGVIVVGATNRLDTLDPALLRPGRFSRHIQVAAPDEPGRLAILGLHAAGRPLAADADLARLAHITAGNSGAELAEMLNEAAIWAARDDRDEITDADLWEGLCRVLAGPRKASSSLAEGEREIVAYHEAGHVLAGELCPTQDRTEHATINARGRALGFALKGRTDRGLQTEQYLHESLIFILGGRAAEYVRFGTVSSGAANDLQQAGILARTAVEEWGLSDRVGQLSRQAGRFSDATQAKVDEEVARLVADAYADAVELIRTHGDQLEQLAGALLATGDISRAEIDLAMHGARIAPRPPRRAHAPVAASRPARPAAPARERSHLSVLAGGVGRAVAALLQRPGEPRTASTD